MAKLKRTVIVGGLSGSSGPVNFKLTKDGTIVSERATPTNPNTAAQEAARARFTISAQTFKGFSPTTETSWKNYGSTLERSDRVTGGRKQVTALNAYMKLACKFLQVNNGGTPPTTPPTTPFNGDSIAVSATAGTGKVTFTATAANSAGTKTELLLQPLASPLRNPKPKGYRTQKFVTFIGGGLSSDVNVGPGYYAAAYRFVNTTTGQETALVPIGVAQVTLALESGSSAEAPSTKKKAA